MGFWDKEKHPRDRLGRFRTVLHFDADASDGGEYNEDRFADDVSHDYDEWRDSLDDDEFLALQNYAQDQEIAEAMNTELRHGGIDDEELNDWIRTATDALGRSEVPQNTVAFRELNDPAILDAARNDQLIGTLIADQGFMSTTLDGSFGGRYSEDAIEEGQRLDPGDDSEPSEEELLRSLELQGATHSDAQSVIDAGGFGAAVPDRVMSTVATIRIPKGVQGAYLGELSGYADEQELLLQNGTVMRVTGWKLHTNEAGNSTLFLAADVVEQLSG